MTKSGPIVRIRNGEYTVWSTDVRYARGMAVSRRRALLYGGYESDGTARVLELDDKGEARVVETVDVVDKGGEAIPRGARVWGIGARLYLHTDDRLLVVQGW